MSDDFFPINTSKNSLRNTISVKQIGSRRPDILSGLIWVHTVWKENQQKALVGGSGGGRYMKTVQRSKDLP